MEQSENLQESNPDAGSAPELESNSAELPSPGDIGDGAPDAQADKGVEAASGKPPEDSEIEIEIGDKKYVLKQSDAAKYLENISQLTEREKELLERERKMNRDYTKKSQANSELQKSISSVFGGRMPESQELQCLGKLMQSYFADPMVQKTVDSIIAGNFREFLKSAGKEIPDQEAIEERVARLIDQRFGTYDAQMKARQREESEAIVNQMIEDFVTKKQQSGAKLKEDQKEAMLPYMKIVAQRNPKWTDEQILERAFKLVTIEDVHHNAVNDVLTTAGKAKNAKPPVINSSIPKGMAKKTYRDIILEEAV